MVTEITGHLLHNAMIALSGLTCKGMGSGGHRQNICLEWGEVSCITTMVTEVCHLVQNSLRE